MKHRLSILLLLVSYAALTCGQIVFPSPNQVEMKKGKLNLRKNISMYTADTTAFYVSLLRSEVLRDASVKWQSKASAAHICWMNDPSLPPEGYKISINPKQMTITASGERGFIYAVQT
ncbi:glycoside hydrolase family 20 zincin-like fold domain-containing protein, partial [uncultured Bacteroides sp.]